MTVGIADTTDSGDPLSLIRPPEGGRISLMLSLRDVKSGPEGPHVKIHVANPSPWHQSLRLLVLATV